MSDVKVYQVKPINITFTSAGTEERYIETSTYNPLGYWSAQVKVTGSATVDVAYAVTNLPERELFGADTDIVTGAVTATHNYGTFEPSICRTIKLTITSTGASEVGLYVIVQ